MYICVSFRLTAEGLQFHAIDTIAIGKTPAPTRKTGVAYDSCTPHPQQCLQPAHSISVAVQIEREPSKVGP